MQGYNPWRDMALNWPDVEVRIAALPDGILGEIRGGGELIVLRRGTTSAQRRCTLAHEIVHLERGLPQRLPPALLAREERRVDVEVGRRLIPIGALADAIAAVGPDERVLATELWVDRATLRGRLCDLTRRDPSALSRLGPQPGSDAA